MSWSEFCAKNKMGMRYHGASFETNTFDKPLLTIAEEYLKNPESLVLHGKAGRGKTFFSICLLKALFEKFGWEHVRWIKSKSFEDTLVSSVKEYGNARDCIEAFSDVQFLIIDDFGTETTNDDVKREWFHLIDDRWSNAKQTVFTTNLNEQEVSKMYGERIFSRFKDFLWVEFKGQDLRGRR